MPRPAQDGLKWVPEFISVKPVWTREPCINAVENVCRQQLKLAAEDLCDIAFLEDLYINKAYAVRTAERSYVMHVSLPVDPGHMTHGEVVTMQWVRENTSIPVPRVFAFDDGNDNEIGFEWILVEHMSGTSAQKRWRTMSMEQKVALTKQVAGFQLELAGLKTQNPPFTGIGTLQSPGFDLLANPEAPRSPPAPGHMVMWDFFKDECINYDVPKGPFRTSHDWLSSMLRTLIREDILVLKTSQDESELEETEEELSVTQRLLAILPRIFPPESAEAEPSALRYHGMGLDSILIDEQGGVTAVLNWGLISVQPGWMLSSLPDFLIDQTRKDEPQRDQYMDETPEDVAMDATLEDGRLDLDNEGKNELYWIHLMEYDATVLSKIYKAAWDASCPERIKEDAQKSDFFSAVMQSHGFWVRDSRTWVECFERGEYRSFDDIESSQERMWIG